jgi:hypothetical protein
MGPSGLVSAARIIPFPVSAATAQPGEAFPVKANPQRRPRVGRRIPAGHRLG